MDQNPLGHTGLPGNRGEPSDEDNPFAEAERKVLRRRALTRRIAAAVAILYALYFTGAHLPRWMFERGHKAAVDCLNEHWEHASSDPMSCVGRQRWWNWLPKLWPSTRKEALADEASSLYSGYEYVLTDAVATHPDAAARKSAVLALLQAGNDPLLPNGRSASLAHAWLSGAFAELAATDAGIGDHGDWLNVLQASVAVTDFDAIRRAASVVRSEKYAYDYNLQRGAWLCLLGDRKNGIAALAVADTEYRTDITSARSGWLNARLAIVACGAKPSEALGFDPRRVGEFEQHEMDALVESVDPSALDAAERHLKEEFLEPGDRLPFVAQALTQKKHDVLGTLALVDSHTFQGGSLVVVPKESLQLTPSMLLRPETGLFGDQPYACDPAPLEAAAALLETTADGAKETYPPGKDKDGYDEAEASYDTHLLEMRKHPKVYLRNAAWGMWIAASTEWARRGERDKARADVERAMKLTLENEAAARITAITLFLTIGDAKRASELGQALVSGPLAADAHAADRAIADVQLALALAAQGRFEEANEVAKTAHLLAPRLGTGDAATSLINDIAWLHAALALRVGKGDEVLAPEPGILSEALAPWLARAKLPEEQRKIARRQRVSSVIPSQLVLPAFYYVIGKSVEGAGDVEVWLDHVFAVDMARGGRAEMAARAEAARWRSDTAAAEVWEGRDKKLRSLIHDHPTSILAAVAGL